MIRYHARWVLPVDAPPVRNGSVVIDGDCIAWVGPRHDAPAGTDVELGDAIITPGLVNTHIHLDLAAFSGALRARAFFPWVRTLVRVLDAMADSDMRADSARWSVADQLAHGVTTMAHTGPGRESFDALCELGARGIAYFETFGPDPAVCGNAMANLRARVHDARAAESSLARVGVSPHAPYSVSDQLYAAVAEYARAESLPVAVHIAESLDETNLVVDGRGEFAEFLHRRGIAVASRARSPIALLSRTGVLATRALCIHAIRVDHDDVQRIADAGATVAHCPMSNAWFGHDAAPLSAMRAAGIAVGLGTDSIASNDGVRVLAEARNAVDRALTADVRLDMATRSGARALGLDTVVGSLTPGLAADIAAFRVHDISVCDANPTQYLVERCSDAPSLVTIVSGTVRARDGRALALEDGVARRLDAHRARVRSLAELTT